MNLKAILFDFDGVLVDACDWHFDALNEALTMHGYYPISRSDHETIYNGLPTLTKLKMMGIPPDKIKSINNLKQELTEDKFSNIKVDYEKIELMFNLRKHVFIGCVSNCSKKTLHMGLHRLGIATYLNVIISNDSVDKQKPHPDPYLRACDLLNRAYFHPSDSLKPENCLVIEDSDKGVLSGASAGMVVFKVKNATEVNNRIYELFFGKTEDKIKL